MEQLTNQRYAKESGSHGNILQTHTIGKLRLNGFHSVKFNFTVCYAEMSLLPFLEAGFAMLKNVSPQETRFLLGREITRQIFSCSLLDWAKNEKSSMIHRLRDILFSKTVA